jgi:arsenate reductase
LHLLGEVGASGLPAGEISVRLGLSGSTASFHLAALEHAGLLQATRKSRSIRYATRYAALRSTLLFLAKTCCGGQSWLSEDVARFFPDEEDQAVSPSFNVLFLCTRNSARSLMAEAILRDLGRSRFNVYSAGSAPAAVPLPEVLEKLRALGHDTTTLHCKSWHLFTGPVAPRLDFVIALCDVLDGQICPDFGDSALTASWPLPDPTKFSGNATERAILISELYASLRRRLEIFANLSFAALDRMALKARLDEIGDAALAYRSV